MTDNSYDVVVIGGGAAGLSGALTLARARRSVLVIDAGEPRNSPAEAVHGYLGREGVRPAELSAIGRDEVASYGGEVVSGTVTAARRLGAGTFRVELADGGAVSARRLLVATGLVDGLPAIPGLAQRWGTRVLHCPYCHGWEVRDAAIGIIALNVGFAVHQALLWRQWSDDVTLFLHTADDPTAEQWEELAARGVAVVDGEIAGIENAADVRLRSGRLVARHALVVATRMNARLPDLGLDVDEQRFGDAVIGTAVAADPTGATAVPGVFVAGNVTALTANVVVAAAAGLTAAAALNADLSAEDTRRAVAERRSARAVAAVFSAASERVVHEMVSGGSRHGL